MREFDEFGGRHGLSGTLFGLSIIAVILSIWGFITTTDFMFNSNTWLIIAAVLGIWANYLHRQH